MDSLSLMEFVKHHVETGSLLLQSNVMIRTTTVMMAAQPIVKLKLFGPALVFHLFVHIMALLFVETVESKEEKNVMMETWPTEMDVQTHA